MDDEKIKEKIKEILMCFGCGKNNSDDDVKIFFNKFLIFILFLIIFLEKLLLMIINFFLEFLNLHLK